MTFGTIFDIKRFAVHDGQGIRTTLFLKGCPLHCPWCHNPEGIDSRIRLVWTASKCLGCGLCVDTCPVQALTQTQPEKRILVDHTACRLYGECVKQCPGNALDFDGRQVSAEDTVVELLRDRVFFETSGGGVTLSGGEPLMQPEFAYAVLRMCKNAGIHTALETSLAVQRTTLEPFLEVTDQFLVDLKVAEEMLHRKWLGRGNADIHSNLRYLVGSGANVTVRIPMIPGYTAREENLHELGAFVRSLGSPPPPVELINFNPLAVNKYRMYGYSWPFGDEARPYTQEELDSFVALLAEFGLQKVLH